jgi:glucose-6-phosphate isomerase
MLSAWDKLKELASQSLPHMREMFANDPLRTQTYQLDAAGWHLDFAKNRINQEVFTALVKLAQESQVEAKRDAMFGGETINSTEGRAVLHTALRNFSGEPVLVDGHDVIPEVMATLSKMEAFCDTMIDRTHLGYTDKPITDVVSIGIGGSFLGPKIMTEALKPYQHDVFKVHFVANVDGCHIQDVLAQCNPETTFVLMSSKSFSTQETLQNTLTAKSWFLGSGAPQQAIAKHFAAVSSNVPAAVEFGMSPDMVFPMNDWVGGRYSLWSAIGLPIALAIGFTHFKQLLEGAFAMDTHFKTAPLEQNMPVLLALLGIWYRNFNDAQSHVLLPYYHYLRGFPAYVQQLDMESNGKRNALDGSELGYATGPIIFGSEGTNGQHSFHQLIHQSETLLPVDFIFPLRVPDQDATHHAMLAANCFGQAQALMQGKTFDECYADLPKDMPDREVIAAHKVMPGNKPSNTLLCDELSPFNLGSLVALYEHKVFVQGAIWGLNSFDQWGVELGKVLGNQVLDALQGASNAQLDSSTQDLVNRYRNAQS